ncbi:hypothetical protein MJO28_012539 [Puccinia striiformis f. sp. tritici]|uniref:Uncharacterized protein n=1 Tax=Puccinia striiformis f. sp. tritici TaxID=168172 RepID=A0ACC0E0H7_9BASI|nr:hypothetical protein MJO28_012539 [Puccinia striiformis f. sp. tritici]
MPETTRAYFGFPCLPLFIPSALRNYRSPSTSVSLSAVYLVIKLYLVPCFQMVDSAQKTLVERREKLRRKAGISHSQRFIKTVNLISSSMTDKAKASLDLVMKGFEKLSHRWLRAKVRGENPPKDTLKDLSPEQIRSRQDHIKRLNSTFLPGLEHRVDNLSKALHPPNHVWNHMSRRFDNILSVQTEIDLMLREILSATQSIGRRRDLQSITTEDQYLNEFKYYIISSFEHRVHRLFFYVGEMADQALEVVRELDPSPWCQKQKLFSIERKMVV